MMKIPVYGNIKEEAGVVMVFSKIHELLGFPKLVPSSARGFDIDDIEYKNGRRVTVEFEYLSENFINHGHVEKMKDGRHYIVICYEDNCNIIEQVRKKYKKTNLELIEIKKYIEIKHDRNIENEEKIEYIVLNYNPKYADNISINQWIKSNVYALNAKFKNDFIIPGSKILFKQGSYIVAGCEVVRYEVFEKPKSDNEWKLFFNIVNYPNGIFNLKMEELKKDFARGYIFYDEFILFEERKINFKKVLPNRNMGRQGMIKISKAEYDILLGN